MGFIFANEHEKLSDQVDLLLMHMHIIKEVLLKIGFDRTYMEHFIDHYRTNLYDDNAGELESVEKFEHKYRKQGSIR